MSRILAWFRQWLPKRKAKPPYTLKVRRRGQEITAEAFDVSGLFLVCSSQSQSGAFLVYETHAVDRERYWQIWRALNHVQYYWEDGEKFDPN